MQQVCMSVFTMLMAECERTRMIEVLYDAFMTC